MPSEKLASGENLLKGELAAAWNILEGSSGDYTDLGIARRFGGAAAAYSLRDIGAMNGRVVKARREPHDGSTTSVNDEEDFSASQVQSGVLEDWVNGKLESTLPAENSPQLAVQVVIEHSDINSGASTTLKFFPQTTYTTRTPTVDGITYSIRDIIYKTYPLNVAGSFQLYADGNARWKINAFNTSTSSYDDAICHLKTTDPDRRTFNYSGGTSGLTFTQAVTRTPIDFPTTSDWVTDSGTGTLTSIAITSVSPAAAAYSLRKVNSSYSGNAVRIRRSSDDVEVDVAFDSDDKVSASSAITNIAEQGGEIGSTTATDLNGFLNETLTVGVAVEGGSGSDRPDSFTNATNSSFTATVTETAGGYFPYKTATGDVITVSFDIVLSGSASPSLATATSVNTVTNASTNALYTSSGSYTTSLTCTEDATHIRFADGDDGTFAVTNFKIVSHTHQAFVHTWYDQTKDLTQLSTYFNSTLSSSNFGVNAMTEEFGTFLGRDNAVKLTSTAGNTQRFDSIDFGIGANESVRFTAQIYVPSTNTALDSFAYSEIFTANGFDRKQGVITPTQDQWVDIDFNYVQADDTIQRLIFWNSASSTPTANNNSDGDVIYFRNMVVTRVAKGQNNAVQATAANQPKIAENGALLDGINFNANTDGTSPDFLQVATRLGVTTDHFVSVVFNGYQTNSSAFGAIINTRTGNAGYQYGIANADKVQAFFYAGAGNNANSSSNFVLSNNSPKRLVTFDKDGNDLTGFGNAVTNGISLSNGVNTPSTTVTNIGVGGNVGTTTSLGLRANINELIVYESDQADNRFKIESNINNYYGLYNDANELSAAFDSNGTITGESKDGFTADVATFSHYVNATFNNSVATSETIYVSFNAQLAPNGGTAASPILRLQDAQVGSNTSNQSSISEGFNSIDLTATGTSDRVGFLEQDDNVDYIISDFKVSRIARNGFVETLYDQSANGDDMTQATAGSQPAIVQNGGQVKLICGKPAFKGDGTNDFLEASYFYSAGEVTSLSGFTVCSNDSDTGQEEAIISAGYGLSTTYPGFTIQLDRNSNADPFEIRTANASGSNETPLLSIAKDGDILGSTFFTKDDTQLVRATTKDGSFNNSEATSVGALHSNSTSGKLRIGAIRSFAVRQFFGFFISEAIVFKGSDLRDEGIENEINQFYNIG
jgi:hypothetical protein